ncbi:hypothetical protein MRB53_020618 [Persea americana]|uniref:Uncharacterized protein n=1 Tax=Persea americana TaxID=3435 RepID=A0ACC2L1A8_PERAE|nr:hypothetical protein MRB53_020618 [Persea americana]
MSIATSIGKPLRLDEITTKQRMFSFTRVLVLLNVAIPSPKTLSVDLEGEGIVQVEVQYESIPCSECLSASHLSTQCPFRMRPDLLKNPAQKVVLIAPPTYGDLESKEGANLQVSPTPEVFPPN